MNTIRSVEADAAVKASRSASRAMHANEGAEGAPATTGKRGDGGSAQTSVERWLAAYRTQAASLPGAGLQWLSRLREAAIERFGTEGWPTHKLENWRHTSLKFLEHFPGVPGGFAEAPDGVGRANIDAAQGSLSAPVTVSERVRTQIGRIREEGGPGHWLVFVDGHLAPEFSDSGALPEGVRLDSLAQLLADDPERVRPWFSAATRGDGRAGDGSEPQPGEVDGPRAGTDGEITAALNTAFVTDGAVLSLEPGVVLAQPVHLLSVRTPQVAVCSLRTLVVAGAGAQATVIEHTLGSIDSAQTDDERPDAANSSASTAAKAGQITNLLTRLFVGRGARIAHLKLQQDDRASVHLATLEAFQQQGSSLAMHSVALGASLARNDIVARFEGEDCELLLNGLYHVDAKRHVDHHTRIEHAFPACSSREFYRGILDDEARGVFTGRILVGEGAVRTDAVQRTDSLLLSPRAEADARPELEIYADDVKCAHGATVGELDDASLFYLRSRGLDPEHARNLLTYAFAAEVLARIDVTPLRQRADAAIRSRLPGGELLEMSQ